MPEIKSRSSEDEIGVVTSLQNGDAVVELSFQEACESCGAKMLCVPDSRGKRQLRVENKINARVGNQVSIIEKSNYLLVISFLQYGLPLIGFMAGITILYGIDLSSLLLPKELIMFLGGLSGLIICAFISRYFVGRIAGKGHRLFEISGIIR